MGGLVIGEEQVRRGSSSGTVSYWRGAGKERGAAVGGLVIGEE